MDAITDTQRAVLQGIADDLRSGAIPAEKFDMEDFDSDCSTIHCIGGWARTRDRESFAGLWGGDEFEPLFFPGGTGGYDATPAQAAQAIDNFLADGNPRWADVMAEA